MGSASVIAMAAGIGADYAIYFLYRLREERARLASDTDAFAEALHTSGRAVLFVAASIGAGFAVMGFSQYLGMRLSARSCRSRSSCAGGRRSSSGASGAILLQRRLRRDPQPCAS